MFGRKREKQAAGFNREREIPVIRSSICTGEQVAGFRRLDDGKFEEVMLVRNDADLEVFREEYGITGEIEKIY